MEVDEIDEDDEDDEEGSAARAGWGREKVLIGEQRDLIGKERGQTECRWEERMSEAPDTLRVGFLRIEGSSS
jgi:hypothetical protein